LINDEGLGEQAQIIREKGTNRSRFFRDQVEKYTWVDLGSSYLPSDMLAAFLLAQFRSAKTCKPGGGRYGELIIKACKSGRNHLTFGYRLFQNIASNSITCFTF
jgi:dTDP-4-amino-4,6-dideoxygalactose transaminase